MNEIQDVAILILTGYLILLHVLLLRQWKTIQNNREEIKNYKEKFIPYLKMLDEQNTKFREIMSDVFNKSKDPEIKKMARKLKRIGRVALEF